MKTHVLLFSFILPSAFSFAQPGVKIAYCHRYSGVQAFPFDTDSTAYYYDGEGNVSSSVQYHMKDLGEKWEPRLMNVYLVNKPGQKEVITYDYNEQKGKWKKVRRSVVIAPADKSRYLSESYVWSEDQGRFYLDSQKNDQAIYNGNKKLSEYRVVSCESCRSSPQESNITYRFFYDQNDSLSTLENWNNIPSPALNGKVTYTYQSQGPSLFVTRTNYWPEGSPLASVVQRYDSGKLILILNYAYSNGQTLYVMRDSLGYNASGARTFMERGHILADGSYERSMREFITVNSNGLVLKDVRENWLANKNAWVPDAMIEWTYNSLGSYTFQKRSFWDTATAAWVVSYAEYLKYNEYNQETEAGNVKGTDSVWFAKYYYSQPTRKYDPDASGLHVSVYPNPGSDLIKVHILSKDYLSLQFSLFDAAGRRVMDQPLSVAAGINDFDLSMPQIKPGCYLYVAKPSNGLPPVTDKLMIVK